MGKSGEGKSTLLDLISGIIEPSSGTLKVDDLDISANLEFWRKKLDMFLKAPFFR